ncbi:MAG: DUF4129 domain-containing protein [Desulfobacterales bacterium]|nr:DUF4129 domain-containing protein [Desulfobacterales bacterium]
MDKTATFFLTLSAGCMALVWRLAVANYISLAAFKRPYPLPEAVIALCLAALICAATRHRGLRVITVIGLHGFGLAVAILRTVYVYHTWSHSFISLRWITQWLDSGPDINAWSAMLLQAMLAVGFWWGGIYLIRGRERLQSHYARLDIGLTAFFVLFLAKFILWHKSGIEIQDFLSEKLLISFMIFGLLAIAMARHQGTIRTQFISGKKIIGMTLSASAVVVLFSTGLMMFFLPYMTAAAEFGYTVLKTVSGPVGAVLIAILRLMFAPRRMDQQLSTPDQNPSPVMSGEAVADNSWWFDLIEKVIGYVVLGVGTMVLLAAMIALVWLLVGWLWRRTPDGDKNRNGGDIAAFRAWFKALVLQIASLCRTVLSFFCRPPRTGTAFFGALLVWGRRSGIPVRTGETPLEYGQRLKAGFPVVGPEIATIVNLFNQEKYGEQALDLHGLDSADASWRKVRSPLHWGRRLRTWFLQQGDRA